MYKGEFSGVFQFVPTDERDFFLKLILSVYDYLRKLFKFLCFFWGGGAGAMEFIAGIYILQFITNAYPPNWLV